MSREEVKKQWAVKLKRARTRTKLSQMALGTEVGMSQSKISKIEKGELLPDMYDYTILRNFFRKKKIPLHAER